MGGKQETSFPNSLGLSYFLMKMFKFVSLNLYVGKLFWIFGEMQDRQKEMGFYIHGAKYAPG